MSKCNKHRYVSTSPKVCVVCLLSQLATKEATIAELREGLSKVDDLLEAGHMEWSQEAITALLENTDG
mgnify:FL=1